MEEGEKSIQEDLSLPILLSHRLIKSANEAELSRDDCAELAEKAESLSLMLRSVARLAAAPASQPLYVRPLRRVAADVARSLERGVGLARKCRYSGFLRHVFSITAQADFRKLSSAPSHVSPLQRVAVDVAKNLERGVELVWKCMSGFLKHVFSITAQADFRKVFSLLDSSTADVSWLLSILDPDGGSFVTLPPIAKHDPILAMLWSSIASVQMGQLQDKIDAANNLASLARDSDRNKKMIVDEGGVVPLLRLLKDGGSSDAQIAAASALLNLGNDQELVQCIAAELAVPMIVKVLGDSPMKVQIAVANLAAKMAEMNPTVQEEFGKENIHRPLVTLLSMDISFDDPKPQPIKRSIDSLVQINKDLLTDLLNQTQHSTSSSSLHKKEFVSPELKGELKVTCAKALWKLAKGSLVNSKKITETKGLLCLAKLIEIEREELQVNCLMAVMEITIVAESNSELRRTAFKPNSPAAKAVLEQLLRVVNTEIRLQLIVPAMRSIGALARTFPAKETRIIRPLVNNLAHRNANVAAEAVISLTKFVCPENFNCKEYSKLILEFDGVPKLMNLIKINGRNQVNELVLLCFLSLHVGNSKALEQARALNVLEGALPSVVTYYPELRELFTKALHSLTLYQVGIHTHRQAYVP